MATTIIKKPTGGAITPDSIYYKQAQQQIDPSYNNKIQAMNNALATQQQSLEQQKTGINNNYNTMVTSQNRNNNIAKNNLSNQMLGRGLGRSSIVTSGLAQQDQINNRMLGQIENQRQGDLSNIDAQKSLLAQNNASAIAQMEANKIDEYYALARQLMDRDYELYYKDRADVRAEQQQAWQQAYQDKVFGWQQEQDKWNNNYKDQQLAWSKDQFAQELAYKNNALAQQQALQQAQLAWSKEQFAQELAYKQQAQAQAQEKEKQQLLANITSQYFDNLNSATSRSEMDAMNKKLYAISDTLGAGNDLYNLANKYPYVDPSYYSQQSYTSSSKSKSSSEPFSIYDTIRQQRIVPFTR